MVFAEAKPHQFSHLPHCQPLRRHRALSLRRSGKADAWSMLPRLAKRHRPSTPDNSFGADGQIAWGWPAATGASAGIRAFVFPVCNFGETKLSIRHVW